MATLIKLFELVIVTYILTGCGSGKTNTGDSCEAQLRKAIKIIENPKQKTQTELDTALQYLNQSILCDSTKKVSVELKITVLEYQKSFSEAIKFIDSLQVTDFNFIWHRQFHLKTLRALSISTLGEPVKNDSIYRDISAFLYAHIQSHEIGTREFNDVYTLLFATEAKFMNKTDLNRQIDSFIGLNPSKAGFFQFFRNVEQ